MKLTKALRDVIILQFKQGEDMEYLAKLYGFTLQRIEQAVRQALIEGDEVFNQQAKEKSHGIDTNSD